MLVSGMTSVTFRKKSLLEIAKLCKQANLKGVEWGGDVHVPPCSSNAKEAYNICKNEGLKIFSYGSYYSITNNPDYIGDFKKVLDTCDELDTKVVRVWATRGWRDDATTKEYLNFVKKIKDVSILAKERDVTICFEHHQKTFCDTLIHTKQLLEDINCDNVKTYWQPICGCVNRNTETALELKDIVTCIHVYYWLDGKRFSLRTGLEFWEEYFQIFANVKREIPCLLEFSKDDCEQCFLEDAKCLNEMLDKTNKGI